MVTVSKQVFHLTSALLCFGLFVGCGEPSNANPDGEFQQSNLDEFFGKNPSMNDVRERFGKPHRTVDNRSADGTVLWEYHNDEGILKSLAGGKTNEFVIGIRVIFRDETVIRWYADRATFSS